MLGYLAANIICSEKGTVFRERNSRKTLSFEAQNVQGQISKLMFAPNGGYCVYCPSNIFHNTHGFEHWGISLRYSPVLFRRIFSHMTCLDQFHMSSVNPYLLNPSYNYSLIL